MGEIFVSIIKFFAITMALVFVGSIIGLGYEIATYKFSDSAPFWNWLTYMYVGAIIAIVSIIVWMNESWHKAK